MTFWGGALWREVVGIVENEMMFALVAVFLAVLGVHGVLSYLVAQRSHEVGVRMALGATRKDVLKLIVSQGMTITVLGLAAGTLGALATSKLLEGLLFGVSPTEPVTYVAVVMVLGAAAAIACALPANRAARIHPTAALRGATEPRGTLTPPGW